MRWDWKNLVLVVWNKCLYSSSRRQLLDLPGLPSPWHERLISLSYCWTEHSSFPGWGTCSEMLNKEWSHSLSFFHLARTKHLLRWTLAQWAFTKVKTCQTGSSYHLLLFELVTLLRAPTDPKDILTSAKGFFTQPGSSSQGHVDLCHCSSPPHGDSCQGIQ